MGSERRVAACVLLLMAALPLLWSLLPEQAMVAAIPAAALLVATTFVLAPFPARVHRVVAPLTWIAGAATVVLYTGWFVPMDGLGWLAFVPFGVALLVDREWPALAATAAAGGLLMLMPDGPTHDSLGGFTTSPGVDLVGPACAVAWAAWQLWSLATSTSARGAIRQQAKTAKSLDEAIARDRDRLEAVAVTVADPSLRGPVREHGLGPDALGLAARIDRDRILLGWIDGSPMATLTCGWALLAAARAGLSTPRDLLRFARTHLDEVVPPTAIRWVGVWDRPSTYLEAAPIPSGAYHRCRLSSRGPNGTAPTGHDTAHTVAELLELPDDGMEEPDGPPRATLTYIAAATAIAATALSFVPGPWWLAAACVAILCGTQVAQTRVRVLVDAGIEHGRRWLEDRIEVHDDLRFAAAKVHGGMLPYRIEVGDTICTAHRLRGEVLDGAFADMVVDDRGIGHVIAGEVAGRGIAARFLGVAAQVTAHVRLSQTSRQGPQVGNDVLRRIAPMGDALKFPVRMRFGEVKVQPTGHCVSSGLVDRMVEVKTHDPAQGPALTRDFVGVTSETLVGLGNRLYISPAAALPGPEDDAPALAAGEATDRIYDIVSGGRWNPSDGTLPSLFSLVFDGRHAPAHGTLIEIAQSREEESDGSAPLVAI